MPIVYEPSIICEECAIKKTEVNNWFVCTVKDNVPTFYPFSEYILKYKFSSKSKKKTLPYCGQNCIGKAFQRWLDTGTLEKPNSVEVNVTTEAVNNVVDSLENMDCVEEYAKLIEV